jgi:hypothetical protein
MFGASSGLEREKIVALCKSPKYSTFKTEDISMVLFHRRPVLLSGQQFRQAEIPRSLNRAFLLNELEPVGSAIAPTQRRLNT